MIPSLVETTVLHRPEKLMTTEWFRYYRRSHALEEGAPVPPLQLNIAGHEDDPSDQMRPPMLHRFIEGRPVDLWHPDVTEDEVEVCRPEHIKGLTTAGGSEPQVPFGCDQPPETSQHATVVVHDENPPRRRAH
jgi:hypothetical protein